MWRVLAVSAKKTGHTRWYARRNILKYNRTIFTKAYQIFPIFATLPLPFIIINAIWRTKDGVGLGMRLLCMHCKLTTCTLYCETFIYEDFLLFKTDH